MNYDIIIHYTSQPDYEDPNIGLACVGEEDAKTLAIILSRYGVSISMSPLVLDGKTLP